MALYKERLPTVDAMKWDGLNAVAISAWLTLNVFSDPGNGTLTLYIPGADIIVPAGYYIIKYSQTQITYMSTILFEYLYELA